MTRLTLGIADKFNRIVYSVAYMQRFSAYLGKAAKAFGSYWQHGWQSKIVVILITIIVLVFAAMYSIAIWYKASENTKPLRLGASFVPAYAESLGLDAKQTMDALINDLGIRNFRLVSYWSQLEPQDGEYDFDLLDWQFEKAEAAGASVSLAIGLRQPRWPECHIPDWAKELPDEEWQPKLERFIAAVVTRYKDSPSLGSYQLENEFLHKTFGTCTDFDRERINREFDLVKSIDPNHPIIMSRSNNWWGLALGKPVPDQYGISVYRRVWEPNINRYTQYPFPTWYYGFLAGAQKLLQGKPSILHELQAEAWPPDGQNITDISLEEQNKSIDADRLRDGFEFGRATGLREIYLWGAEYWYYRKIILNDPGLWNVARQEFDK